MSGWDEGDIPQQPGSLARSGEEIDPHRSRESFGRLFDGPESCSSSATATRQIFYAKGGFL